MARLTLCNLLDWTLQSYCRGRRGSDATEVSSGDKDCGSAKVGLYFRGATTAADPCLLNPPTGGVVSVTERSLATRLP